MTYAEFVAKVRAAGLWEVDRHGTVRSVAKKTSDGFACCPIAAALDICNMSALMTDAIPKQARDRIARAADYDYDPYRPLLLALCGLTPDAEVSRG